jgi:hypothetical protein
MRTDEGRMSFRKDVSNRSNKIGESMNGMRNVVLEIERIPENPI